MVNIWNSKKEIWFQLGGGGPYWLISGIVKKVPEKSRGRGSFLQIWNFNKLHFFIFIFLFRSDIFTRKVCEMSEIRPKIGLFWV